MEEELLEELEMLIKEHYGDLIFNMAVSAKGSLFVSCWQQTSEVAENSFLMEYWPTFYLIGSVQDESRLILKIISYNGRVIDSLGDNGQKITSEETLDFVEKLLSLELCSGIQEVNGMKINLAAYLIERIEHKVFVRSRDCQLGLNDGRKVCDPCTSLDKEISYEKNVDQVPMVEPTQRSGPVGIRNIEQKTVETTMNSDEFSLDKVKQEVMEDKFTKEQDEDVTTTERPRHDDDNLSHGQDFDQDQESKSAFKKGVLKRRKSLRSTTAHSKRMKNDQLEFSQARPFLCDQCGDTFSRAKVLKFHLDVKGHKSKETAICFQCGEFLDSQIALRRHLWQHQDLRPYKCGQCEYTSTVKEHVYIQHSILKHGKVGSEDDIEYLQDVMKQIDFYEQENNFRLGPPLTLIGTRNKNKANRRKLKTSILIRPQHSCSESNCTMRYQSYKELKKHYQETGHTAKHVCFLCGEIAARDAYLRNHIISIHLEVKPYKCIHCSFTSAIPAKIYNGHYKRMHGNGKAGTRLDVVSIPEAMKIIKDFEEDNKDSLNGLSLVPPPLEEWPDNEDGEFEHDHDSIMKPCVTCEQECCLPKECCCGKLKECCEKIIKEATDSNVEPCEPCGGKEFIECCIMTIKDIKPSDKKQLKTIIKMCCKIGRAKMRKGKLRHQCDTCLLEYDSCEAFENDQNKHQQQMTDKETVNCPTCDVTIFKVKLNEHYENDHPELKAGCCLECLAIVVPKIKMKRHFATIHKPKTKCPICGKHVRVIKDHMAVKHNKNEAKDHTCEVCGKKFRHALLLQSHVAKMHSARKSFPCQLCGKLFKEKCTLTTHYWSIHMKVKPYKCKHCSHTSARTQAIYEHCRTVHKIKAGKDDVEQLEDVFEKIKQFEIQHGLNRQDLKNAKEFICWLCNEKFRNDRERTKHELDHLNIFPYICKVCSNVFKEKRGLKRHYEQVHKDKELANSPIEMDPQLASLYTKLRNIEGHLVTTYQEFKEMNHVVFEKGKAGKKIRCKKCNDTTSDNIAEFLDHFHTLHGHEFIESTSKGNISNENELKMISEDTLS